MQQNPPSPPEADALAEPIAAEPPTAPVPPPPAKVSGGRLKDWLVSHKKISIPLGVLVLIAAAAALPWSRYQAAGLVLKQNLSVKVLDSATNTPVSGATVSSGAVSAQTDANGVAQLRLKDGHRQLTISKTYYDSASGKLLVPILRQKTIPTLSFHANGRQAAVSVVNSISGQVLADVNIAVAGIQAKTDSSGKATVVLPVDKTSQVATLSLAGYNDAKVTVQVSGSELKQNTFKLVAAGKVYFLSNRSGGLDVVSTNLDGSGRKVVLAATGNENKDQTTMVVSPDNKYIALETNRTGSNPLIYVIKASSGAFSLIDKSSATFDIYGWSGGNLIYDSLSNSSKVWLAGADQLKSYNPSRAKTVILSKSAAIGDSSSSAQESFDFVTLTASGTVVYAKSWYASYSSVQPNLSKKLNSLNRVNPDGSAPATIATYPASDSVDYAQYKPNYIYIQRIHAGATSYYSYQIGGGSPIAVSINDSQFYKNYPYYYLSPDYKHILWSEESDGKSNLLVGDALGANARTIARQSDFDTYGWYSNDYLLLSKDNSELYIVSTSGGTPVKVSNYESTSSPGNQYYGGQGGRGGGGY